MQSPHRRARVGGLCGFRGTAEARANRKQKNRTLHLRAGIAEMANAEEGGLATSQQIISKTSITRSAAECRLLT